MKKILKDIKEEGLCFFLYFSILNLIQATTKYVCRRFYKLKLFFYKNIHQSLGCVVHIFYGEENKLWFYMEYDRHIDVTAKYLAFVSVMLFVVTIILTPWISVVVALFIYLIYLLFF